MIEFKFTYPPLIMKELHGRQMNPTIELLQYNQAQNALINKTNTLVETLIAEIERLKKELAEKK